MTPKADFPAASDEADAEAAPSKSARKRDSHARQRLGERLVDLSSARLAQAPISDALREAVELARRIPRGAREGRRRQLQLVGKLMRHEDADAIAAVLDAEQAPAQAQAAVLQSATRWRDRLLLEPDALPAFASRYPGQDITGFVAAARAERSRGGPPHAQRALFRRLVGIISEGNR